MTEKQRPEKRRWTRDAILAAVAGVYRRERADLHRMSQAALDAARKGEAGEYTILDEAADRQQRVVNTVAKVAAALDISMEELARAAGVEEEEQY